MLITHPLQISPTFSFRIDNTNILPTTLAKPLHQLPHAHPKKLIRIWENSVCLPLEQKMEILETSAAFVIFSKSGFLSPTANISIKYVNHEFNWECQILCAFITILNEDNTAFTMTHAGTSYTETGILINHSMTTAPQTFEAKYFRFKRFFCYFLGEPCLKNHDGSSDTVYPNS